MNLAQKQVKTIDLLSYVANDNKDVVLVPSILNYSPSFVKVKSSLKDKFSFVDSESVLGKSIANDDRVKRIDELFPSTLDLYDVQKDLTNVYLKDDDEKKDYNVVRLPVVVRPRRHIDSEPAIEKVIPLRTEELKPKQYLIQPIQYGNQRLVSFYKNIGGGVVSNLEARLSHYGSSDKRNLSRESMYYRR